MSQDAQPLYGSQELRQSQPATPSEFGTLRIAGTGYLGSLRSVPSCDLRFPAIRAFLRSALSYKELTNASRASRSVFDSAR